MRVVWFQVVTDLERAGVTLREQAVTVGVVPGAIEKWKAGTEPLYHNGHALLGLYAQRVGKPPPVYGSTDQVAHRVSPGQRLQTTLVST